MSESTVQYRRVHPVILALSAASSCVNTLFVILMTFASYIATGVYGATAVLAGTILTGSRIFDAITDPLIGLLTDRISTRFGRCRPLAIIGYIATSIAVLAMFVICPGQGQIGVFVLLYLLYIVGYTLFTVGNNMIGPIITNDPKQRPIYSRWMSIYVTVLSTMFSVVLSKTLMPKHGYQLGLPLFKDLAWIVVIAGAVLMLISIIAVTIAKADIPENYVNVKKQKVSFKDSRKSAELILAVGHFPGSFAKISKLTEITFLKNQQKARKSKVLVNSISRGVRRWHMANPGTDPRFVESQADACTEKSPV